MLAQFFSTVISLLIITYILPGFRIENWAAALVAAVIIGVINVFVKPVLSILTLPLTFLTFGIFSLILNALLLWLAAAITPGFFINGFFTAFIGSLLLSLFNSFIRMLVKE